MAIWLKAVSSRINYVKGGSKDHLKSECPKKDAPQCVNYLQNRRKNLDHGVRSKNCPNIIDMLRSIEIGLNGTKDCPNLMPSASLLLLRIWKL